MNSDTLRSERHGPTLVVRVGPVYDSLNQRALDELQKYLLACADAAETRNLVVDLSETTFVGSTFIEVLFRAHSRMKRKGGRFALCGLQRYPAEVIQVAKLDLLWPVFGSASDALKKLAAEEDSPGGG